MLRRPSRRRVLIAAIVIQLCIFLATGGGCGSSSKKPSGDSTTSAPEAGLLGCIKGNNQAGIAITDGKVRAVATSGTKLELGFQPGVLAEGDTVVVKLNRSKEGTTDIALADGVNPTKIKQVRINGNTFRCVAKQVRTFIEKVKKRFECGVKGKNGQILRGFIDATLGELADGTWQFISLQAEGHGDNKPHHLVLRDEDAGSEIWRADVNRRGYANTDNMPLLDGDTRYRLQMGVDNAGGSTSCLGPTFRPKDLRVQGRPTNG